MNEQEKIIEHISQQARVLLQNHWADISDIRNGEESIKIGFGAIVKYEGNKRMVETKISFGKRVTDSVIDWIDPDQTTFSFPSSPAQPVKRGRGRPKKTILERVLASGPVPDPEPEPEANPDWNPPA